MIYKYRNFKGDKIIFKDDLNQNFNERNINNEVLSQSFLNKIERSDSTDSNYQLNKK